VGQRERDRAGVREGNNADRSAPQSSEREGRRERAGWRRQAGPAGAGARLGWAKWAGWAEIGFSFFQGLSICFSIYFL
jgi:hypothetical protein